MEDPTKLESSGNENKTEIKANTTANTNAGDFVAGTVLASRYRIIGMIGKGGMGEVYKAEDIKLGQIVALKFLPDDFQKDSAALERFHAEVRNARQVSHVNVCRVFDIGEIDGKHFLSMEFIDGDDLSSLLRRVGRLSSERAIEIARQLCVGLSAIHNAGILHRDFKPANVIIDSKGKARITDFGIAGVEAEIAKDNLRVGTPAYMSPEQITGRDVSARSDIYALGLVLYEIFTGRQAVEADSIPELIRKQTSESPTNVSEFVKGIDPLVESVISQCIEKDPKDRPASALHVAMALPGGNPMQIALDAGQTPSPEMIAAAPKKGALRPKVALACLVFVVLSLLLTVYIHRYYKSYNFIPLEKTPEVLAEKAQTMIKSFGYTEKPTDIKYRFEYDTKFIEYALENEAMSNSGERLRAGQPAVMHLIYRQSPQVLQPWFTSRVFYFDPPFNVSGMINVVTDTTGRLIEFSVVPPSTSALKPEPVKVDWPKFFTEAGLDPDRFEKTESVWTPPFAFDERIAWKGAMADWADIPIRIEAAAFEGKPIYFRVVTPWDKPPTAFYTAVDNSWATIILLIIFSTLYIGCILLVWYNIKTGRADVRGTFRLVLFVLVVGFLTYLIQADHAATSINEVNILSSLISDILYGSVSAGFLYCALEPFVRRWWSEYLISWSRLLAGDFRDPMVGRDVLAGAFLAGVGSLVFYLGDIVNEFGFGGNRSVSNIFWYDALNSFLRAMAQLSDIVLNSTFTGLSFLVTILIFYLVTRNKKVSLLLFGLLIFILQSSQEPTHPLMYVSGAVLIFLILTALNRFGLLALISFLFFWQIAWAQPLTFDTASILFPQTVATLAIAIGIVAYAAYLSVGGAKVFSGKSFLGD